MRVRRGNLCLGAGGLSLRITSEGSGNTAPNTRCACRKPAISQAGETAGRRRGVVGVLLLLRLAASRGRACPRAASTACPRAQPAPPLLRRPARTRGGAAAEGRPPEGAGWRALLPPTGYRYPLAEVAFER